MWLADFKERFEEALHRLLWIQWSSIGVFGATAPGEVKVPVDPEALLLATLESARTEPRLFDEVLDWLLTNGSAIDIQRLGNLMKRDAGYPRALLGAVAALLSAHDPSAKWRRLASTGALQPEPLFLLPNKGEAPPFRKPDPHFAAAGYLREVYVPRGKSQAIFLHSPAALRFRLRALFGIGIRAEAIAYLLFHDRGSAAEVARAAGYSFIGSYQTLREISRTHLVLERQAGRERLYRLLHEHWWKFLFGREGGDFTLRKIESAGIIPDWGRLLAGCGALLRFLRRDDLSSMSEYVAMSELRAVLLKNKDELEASGLREGMPVGDVGSVPMAADAVWKFLGLLSR